MPCLVEVLLQQTNLKHKPKSYELRSAHMIHAKIRIMEMKIYKHKPPSFHVKVEYMFQLTISGIKWYILQHIERLLYYAGNTYFTEKE